MTVESRRPVKEVEGLQLAIVKKRNKTVDLCQCQDDDAGGGGDVTGSGLSSPTGSTFGANGTSMPYPPVRRANKMSAMQIR